METTESKKWKMWRTILDLKTCRDCRKKHGKIYEIQEKVLPPPPLHPYCRCEIVKLRAILAGNSTKLGVMGADWWIKYYGKLPDYYVSKSEAEKAGWKRKKANLGEIMPKKMIGGNVYQNKNGHLPSAPSRKRIIRTRLKRRNFGIFRLVVFARHKALLHPSHQNLLKISSVSGL